jgi:Zn-dependent protease with chaperone function
VLLALLALALIPVEPIPAAIGAAIVVALLVAIANGAGLRLAVALGLARPADSRLRGIVDECAARTGVAPRAVWVVRMPTVNAFAYPAARELAFTVEAVEKLTDEELAAVTMHELGHVGEPIWVVRARAAGSFVVLPIALARPVLALRDDLLEKLVLFLALVLSALVVSVVVRRIARKMEERADAVAHEHEDEGGAYAKALERIYELNLVPAVTGARRPVHPHLYDRLVSAGAPPSYPRPRPPSRAVHLVAIFALLAILGGGLLASALAGELLVGAGEPDLAVAIAGGEREIEAAGLARWQAGDLDGARPYFRWLAATDPGSSFRAHELAILESERGDCAAAREAFASARGIDDPELAAEAAERVATCEPGQ